jgi:hypothetical protein
VNESALEKYDAVGGSVIVCLPALMRSGSSRVHTGGANTGTGGELPVGVGDHDRSAFVTTHQNVDPRIVERTQHGTCQPLDVPGEAISSAFACRETKLFSKRHLRGDVTP